jgi:RimJ/RimL family protein N-acetyltransferase
MPTLLLRTTPRLGLVPVTPALKTVLRASRAAFEDAIGATVPEGWPRFPEAFEPHANRPSHTHPWHGYLFVLKAAPVLIGNGGFVAAPASSGEVEIGYEVAPAFRKRGYATEAAKFMVELAFEHGARAVVAHSLAGCNASNAVMTRVGMRFAEELASADLGAVWRFRIDRPATL